MTLPGQYEQRSRRTANSFSGLAGHMGLSRGRGNHRRRMLMELAGMEDWQLDDIGRPRHWLEREMAAAGLRQPQPDAWMRRNG